MVGKRIRCLGELKEEVIKKTYELSLKAHKKSNDKYYICDDDSVVVFAFAGSWSDEDWFSKKSFGETKIDLNLFRSLRSIGNEETALVNEAFLVKFKEILDKTKLVKQVEKAIQEKRQIIFTGHSSGGPLAMLTTLWFLEKHTKLDKNTSPCCITFGSPLLGNRIFPHAIRRENWSHFFFHFVMQYDIVPLIMSAPLSSIEQGLPKILNFFNPNSKLYKKDIVSSSREASSFYTNVLTKASSVVNHVACKLMGFTNLLVENLASFVELSPYRPFGTYIFFCTDSNKMVVVENPDAAFQMLFHFSRLNFNEDNSQVACDKLKKTWAYKNMLQYLNMQHAIYLDNASDKDMEELDLCGEAVLCLRAAKELEEQKLRNESNIDKEKLTENLKLMQQYRNRCELKKVGSYDAFKIQANEEDFKINVARLEIAGICDDIADMLKNDELPDTFEGKEEWIRMGTEFRRLYEPVDIANYYRHGRDDDAGTYMIKGRPRRYKYAQRWYEHYRRMNVPETISESCFMAEVEDLIILRKKMPDYDEETKKRIVELEGKVLQWHEDEVLGNDVFLEESTFTKWWNSQSSECREQSCVRHLFADNNVEERV